jgi:putative membrane protein
MTEDAAMADDASDRRFPRRVYGHGVEPDPRFTLANERTFLAWIRTSLALIAAGVALEALGLAVHPGLRLVASVLLLVLGLVLPVAAWWHWGAVESAMRREVHLPAPQLALPLALAVVTVGVLVTLGVATGGGS